MSCVIFAFYVSELRPQTSRGLRFGNETQAGCLSRSRISRLGAGWNSPLGEVCRDGSSSGAAQDPLFVAEDQVGCTRACPLSAPHPRLARRGRRCAGAWLGSAPLRPVEFYHHQLCSVPGGQHSFLKYFLPFGWASLGRKFSTNCPRPPRWAVRARPPVTPTPPGRQPGSRRCRPCPGG